MNDLDKVLLARRAILHVLMRIRSDRAVAQVIGAGTESFDLLTAAASALSGEPLPKIREHIAPGSNALRHSTAEEYAAEL